MTVAELTEALQRLDKGVLRHGSHKPSTVPGEMEFCALEFDHIVRGRPWGDSPDTLPDLRPLNDGSWTSDAARTRHLLPVMAALWNWSSWTPERRQRWAQYVALETVRQIVSALPGLPVDIANACRNAETLDAAEAAAEAAWAAAEAAWAAARAAAWAAETPLILACTIWIAGVTASERE